MDASENAGALMPGRPRNLFAAETVPAAYQDSLVPVVFEPWAEILLARTGVGPGDDVLDIACGTGVVARAASLRAGVEGWVGAVDISPAMLARAAAIGPLPGGAAIDYVEGSAIDTGLPSASFDVVLCQQGLQFFPDTPAAIAEFHRLLRPGGTLGLAVWDDAHRLEPFDHYAEVLAAIGVPEPFPGAFRHDSFTMTPRDVRALLVDAGFDGIAVTVVTTTLVWPSSAAAVLGILGTPFGPLVYALEDERRRQLDAHLTARFTPSRAHTGPARLSAAVIARAVRAR